MKQRHLHERGNLQVTDTNGTELFLEIPLSLRACAKPAGILRPHNSRRVHAVTLRMWSSVVLSFAALLLCLYIILLKCQADRPFVP